MADIDIDAYEEGLMASLENRAISNIAVAGPNAVGKRSLMRSAERRLAQGRGSRRFVYITLGTLASLDDDDDTSTDSLRGLQFKVIEQLRCCCKPREFWNSSIKPYRVSMSGP